MGSFLLRPHETLPCQYFLSFRTGHRGQSLTGRDAVVKHAIIRRSDGSLQTSSSSTATTAATIGSNTYSGSASTSTAAVSSSSTNNYSNNTSAAPHPLTIATPTTPTKPITAAEVATDGSASPLPAALCTPVPTRSALSVHTHTEEGLNADVLPQLRESRYIYHCGKLGPCYSLHDILR